MIIISILLYFTACFSSQNFDISEKAELYLDKCHAVDNIVEKKDTFDTKIVFDFLLDNPNDNSIIEYSEWRNELLL